MDKAPVWVGTAGWSYKDWEDIVYPRAERDKVAFMSRYLDLVEINSSFYRPFPPKYAEKWLGSVAGNERFQFAAKLWSRFTHDTDPPYGRKDLDIFRPGIDVLHEAGKLTALLMQFPFWFRDSPQTRGLLERLSADFAAYPKVLEVRDRSWSKPDAVDFVRKQNLCIACLDMPLAKESFREETLVTGDIAYLRLHGRNAEAWFDKGADRDEKYDYLYNDNEMDQTWQRVEQMREIAKKAVVVWNNHFQGKAAANAFQTLHKVLGEKVDVPELLRQAYPQLERIAKPPKGMLF